MKPLIIFELANNHQGSLDHAIAIVDGLALCRGPYESTFDFAVKFQFRDIDSFIDPRADPESNRHIARFRSTRLTHSQWVELTDKVRSKGFRVITTPFDEESVATAIRLGITTLKVASCSAQEWPLIQKCAAAAEGLIVSTAGLRLDQIDALYSYLRHDCRGAFAILHCTGLYPASIDSLNLSTIRRFIRRYPKARIGYSGHEQPGEHRASTAALAIGAGIFERHVGMATQATPLNSYTLGLDDVAHWLQAMSDTMRMLGTPKSSAYSNTEETESLASLRRGVFASVDIPVDRDIGSDLVSFRFPLRDQQIDVADFTTIYHRFISTRQIPAGEPLTRENTRIVNESRSQNLDRFVQRIRGLASEANIEIADDELLEISHHFGEEEIWSYGCCIINVLNRSYCKKLILMTEGQEHPEQFHKVKDETFRVIWGELQFTLDGTMHELREGHSLVVESNARHSFRALTDVVIEELSTTSSPADSYYTDSRINSRPRTARKSMVRNFIRAD